MISVESIMDTPNGRDEVGTPDDMLDHCERHDVIYRVGSNCLECEREHEGRKSDGQEREGERELEMRREAKAVAGPEPVVRTDGGSDESNTHASATNQMLNKAEEVLELESLRIGLEVSVDGEDDTAVIMRCCDRAAGDYYLDNADESVAEYNDAYPSEDVYQVVFADESDQDLADLTRYPYPRSSLTPVRLTDGGSE